MPFLDQFHFVLLLMQPKKGTTAMAFSLKFGASVQLRGGCNWPKEAEAHTV